MATPTNAQLGKLLASYLSTSTLQNELLVIIDQQKVDFILIGRCSKNNSYLAFLLRFAQTIISFE